MSMARVLDVGRENNEFQRLEVLKRNRTKRKQYGEIFVEGVAPINALLSAGWSVRTVAFDRERPLSNWAKDVLRRARPQKVLRLSSELMERLSDRADPSELILVAERRLRTLEEVDVSDRSIIVVFDRPTNHGNLGSLIRSCDAFGAGGLVTLGHSVDPFDPAVIRASLGAFFSLPVVHCDSPRALESWLRAARARVPAMKVVGTAADASTPLYAADLSGPVTILLGNEAEGLSRALTALADECVAIPMGGLVDSLNVACAGTVVLYEVVRQRGATR